MHYIIHNNPFEINGILHKATLKKSGWSIVYIQWSQVILKKTPLFLPLKIHFVSENSADPYEMPQYGI